MGLLGDLDLKKQLSNVNITATQICSLEAGLQKLSGTVDLDLGGLLGHLATLDLGGFWAFWRLWTWGLLGALDLGGFGGFGLGRL